MRFVIIGAGGIGCYYAARLIEADQQVTLVARGVHLHAMREKGLQVKHPSMSFDQAVSAVTMEEWFETTSVDSVDVIIVCLKAMQTEAFAKNLKGWINQSSSARKPLILSLQNGVENEKHLKDSLDDVLVLGGIARRIGTHIVAPGVVEAVGPAEVIFGVWPNHETISQEALSRVNELLTCFNDANIPTELSTDINKEIWRKLIINNAFNPLCTLLEVETGDVANVANLQPLIRGAMEEAALAASAYGVELTDDDVEGMYNLISTFDSIKPSMLIDREKAKPLEIEEICGVVIRGCELLGKDAPYNRSIAGLLEFILKKDK